MGVTTRRVAMLIVVALNIFLVSRAALSASIEDVQIDRGLMDSIMNLVATTTEAPFNPIQSLMDRLIKLKNILQLILNPTPGNLMSVGDGKLSLIRKEGSWTAYLVPQRQQPQQLRHLTALLVLSCRFFRR